MTSPARPGSGGEPRSPTKRVLCCWAMPASRLRRERPALSAIALSTLPAPRGARGKSKPNSNKSGRSTSARNSPPTHPHSPRPGVLEYCVYLKPIIWCVNFDFQLAPLYVCGRAPAGRARAGPRAGARRGTESGAGRAEDPAVRPSPHSGSPVSRPAPRRAVEPSDVRVSSGSAGPTLRLFWL